MTTSTAKMSEQQQREREVEQEVLFESVNGKGIITLNKPKALNALNLTMIRKIYPQLRAWESSQKLVIIKGAGGKAFCAGGDVRAVTESAKARTKLYKDFFREEYQLNALIGTLHIPYIALIDGITMGGGVGLSLHGQYRVATENTLFAMPETAIGLFPDVGGTYFLPRLGGKLGLFLALSGHRLKGGDLYKAGIATHMCHVDMLPALEQDIISLDPTSSKPKDIEKVLKKYHDQCPLAKKPFSLEARLPLINKAFNAKSVEEIIANLKNDSTDPKWSTELAENMLKMSPTSMKVSMRALETGSQLDLQEALQVEYRLSQHCCENHDFIEGVRARLVDKDQNPQWKPKTLQEVTPEIVDSFFAPVENELIL
jgi:3-hydroxyisobutyryl-CoA hydrolase